MTAACLTAVLQLKFMGAGVLFEKENINTSELSSEMFLSMYSASAQQESISISENMRWSYQLRMKNGEFITCSSLYGYRLKSNSECPVSYPECVDIICG